MGDTEDKRAIMLKELKENDTYEIDDNSITFGTNNEYYCLYLQKFIYKPWSLMSFDKFGIEFRPFRNVRLLQKYNDLNYRKIGYFKEWLHSPEYTYQIYNNGQPCLDEKCKNGNSTTIVKFLCGLNHRIVGFKELKECIKYELIFETPFNCEMTMSDKDKNLNAIYNVGRIKYYDVWIFVLLIFGFLFGSCVSLYLAKKKYVGFK